MPRKCKLYSTCSLGLRFEVDIAEFSGGFCIFRPLAHHSFLKLARLCRHEGHGDRRARRDRGRVRRLLFGGAMKLLVLARLLGSAHVLGIGVAAHARLFGNRDLDDEAVTSGLLGDSGDQVLAVRVWRACRV